MLSRNGFYYLSKFGCSMLIDSMVFLIVLIFVVENSLVSWFCRVFVKFDLFLILGLSFCVVSQNRLRGLPLV